MTAAIAVIISLLIVTLPAEEKDNECGCCCNKASTEGKPLNFYDLIEKTKGWEEDVILLEKELKEKKEKLLELYKQTKEGIYWKEIEDLQSEIEKLETEYWYKKEILFEISVLRKYTELQEDGTLKIVKESLPEVNDFEVDKALNTMEFVGEEKMRKESELKKLLLEEKNSLLKKIETTQEKINKLDKKYWQLRKEYLRLYMIETLKKNKSLTLINHCYSGWCLPPTTPLNEGPHTFRDFQPIKVWVGMYSTDTPSMYHMIDEYCTTYFTTNMSYYWNIAKNRNPSTKSIQIKWFYFAVHTTENQRHDLIWEGNKNSYREWYTYAPYNNVYPNNGTYEISVYKNHHACCYWSVCKWCNTHCGTCFGCDKTRAQYFVTENA